MGLIGATGLLKSAPDREDSKNVIVYKEPGRYGGWPANHGVWSWGNEVVVGFTAAHYKPTKQGHAVNRDIPFEDWQARSVDGGETWSIEKPPVLKPPVDGGPEPRKLDRAMDFQAPGFALMFRHTNYHVGPTRFYCSEDRCKIWNGPFQFHPEGIDKIGSRTDYIVLSKHECLMFGTAAKANDREGKVFCARTLDGGVTWKLVSIIGGEPNGYMIMPSSTMLARRQYITTIRRKDLHKPAAIDCYRSDDDGRTWNRISIVAEPIGSGNPPSLVKLKDGRLCVVYGYRVEPYGIRAKLSSDNGTTWSDEIVLRDDSPTGDLGYPRSIQRPDGKVLSTYYYNGPKDSDRAIEGTIWTP